MDKMLETIQTFVREGRIILTTKAIDEMDEDGFVLEDIKHVILSADHITDEYPSGHPLHRGETLYVIIGPAVNGEWVYTKGAIRENRFYILVSAHLT